MTCRALLLALPSVLLSSVASARIGEDPGQIAKRYGPPLDGIHSETIDLGFAKYEFNGFAVGVSFLDDKSQYEQYRKLEKGAQFTDGEVTLLLQANGEGKDWLPTIIQKPGEQQWYWAGGGRSAFYRLSNGIPTLVIVTKQWMARMAHDDAEREKQNLRGF